MQEKEINGLLSAEEALLASRACLPRTDFNFNRHSRSKIKPLRILQRLERDLQRNTLSHFGEVARSIIRWDQSKLRSRRCSNNQSHCLETLSQDKHQQ